MKIKHLLEYATDSISDYVQDDLIEKVKQDCSRFINEFLKNGIAIYRGNDRLDDDQLHLIPTKAYREAHGNIFYNDLFQTSLERYLEDNNISSRYQHAVSTIAFSPSRFDGVGVDTWFYFLPKGDYRYHYYSNVDNGDINVGNPEMQRLAEVSHELDRVYDMATALKEDEEYIFNNVHTIFGADEKFASHLFKMIDITRNILTHPMVIEHKDIITLDRVVHELDEVLSDIQFEDGNSVDMHLYKETFMFTSQLKIALDDDIYGAIKKFRDSIVADEITKSMKYSEIVFECKEYYAIPKTRQGAEFFRRLTE